MASDQGMSGDVSLAPEQVNTAMKSPEHLKVFLEASGRKYILLDAMQLADALPWPAGHDHLLQILMCYRDHRATQPSGRVRTIRHPVTGEMVEVPVMKTDVMEVEELDRAVRYLIAQLVQLKPDWTLEGEAL